tara:strand:+ start:1943 stop:3727 length:1785 start_codon:yes stop_codon:yes gene_type:complete
MSTDNKILAIYVDESTPNYIRPTPFISVNRQSLSNKLGTFGSEYTITLNGTIIDNASEVNDDGSRSANRAVSAEDQAFEILNHQEDLRTLFTKPVLRFEISNLTGNQAANTVFYATLESLSFEDGVFVNTCRYTATFKANWMQDDGNVLHDGDVMGAVIENSDDPNATFGGDSTGKSVADLRNQFGGIVENFSENWSLEVDEENIVTSDSKYDEVLSVRGYRVTRDISVTGRTFFDLDGSQYRKYEAWSEAKNFAAKTLLSDAVEDYPDKNAQNVFAYKVLNLDPSFIGVNHFRNENIDKANGTISVSDTWLLCSGTAFENYESSIESTIDSPFVSVTLNGSIKGISSIRASGEYYGGPKGGDAGLAKPYENAIKKYNTVTNNGAFGASSFLYKRANSVVEPGLNPQPKSIALSEDKAKGELTYSIGFDNRPQNYIAEAVYENVVVDDTYPGDLYALIPVVGRPTGPVLQYIGGRTEYRRSVSLELVFDWTDLSSDTSARKRFILSKPTLNDPVRSQINTLLKDVSPMSEPNLRKCFLNPPQENWSPKEGRYTLNLSWVYELSDAGSDSLSNPSTGNTVLSTITNTVSSIFGES